MGRVRKENKKENKLKPINIKVRTRSQKSVIVRFGRSEQLGAEILHFSLPRIITCPGRTKWCEENCYAKGGRHIFPSVRKARLANYELSKRKDFVDIMVKAISELYIRGYKVLRLHEEGDFYDEEYIRKWIEIVKELRKRGNRILIYAYTRSWRLPNLLPLLEELRRLPNVVLIASTDRDTGPAPKGWPEAGINFCYNKYSVMCLSDQGKVPDCSNCKLCLTGKVNIYFHVPSSK
jgi:hypothetical protein